MLEGAGQGAGRGPGGPPYYRNDWHILLADVIAEHQSLRNSLRLIENITFPLSARSFS